jgi:hypothetical protein
MSIIQVLLTWSKPVGGKKAVGKRACLGVEQLEARATPSATPLQPAADPVDGPESAAKRGRHSHAGTTHVHHGAQVRRHEVENRGANEGGKDAKSDK